MYGGKMSMSYAGTSVGKDTNARGKRMREVFQVMFMKKD